MFLANLWLCLLVLMLVVESMLVASFDDSLPYVDTSDDSTSMVEYLDYEKKVLRARAYMDILSAESASPASMSYGSIYVDSLSMANLYEDSTSVPMYYYDQRFDWMKPYEFFECHPH